MSQPETPLIPVKNAELLQDFSIQEVEYSSFPPKIREFFDKKLEVNRRRDGNEKSEYKALYKIITSDHLIAFATLFAFVNNIIIPPSEIITVVLAPKDCSIVLGYTSADLLFESKYPQHHNQPFIHFTETSDGYHRKGFALRRLQLLNELCKKVWGFPLRSSNAIEDKAREVWRKLYRLHLVDSYPNPDHEMYRFKI